MAHRTLYPVTPRPPNTVRSETYQVNTERSLPRTSPTTSTMPNTSMPTSRLLTRARPSSATAASSSTMATARESIAPTSSSSKILQSPLTAPTQPCLTPPIPPALQGLAPHQPPELLHRLALPAPLSHIHRQSRVTVAAAAWTAPISRLPRSDWLAWSPQSGCEEGYLTSTSPQFHHALLELKQRVAAERGKA